MEVRHRFPDLTAWLDRVRDLGFTGVQLGPIFQSVSHGYDTLDYFRIDPRLGDEADFLAFVEAAHERGLAVMLDGVFNHVSREHPLAQRALAEGHESEAAGMFVFRQGPDGNWYPDAFEGSLDLLTLNHASPQVADMVTEVMAYWCGRGVDAWRLDAAYAVPMEFWADVLPRVRRDFPDLFVLGEVIHGDYAAFVREGGMDSVTQYELWKAIWSSLDSRNLYELAWALKRHAEFLETFEPVTFLSNHDVTRILTQVGYRGAQVAACLLFAFGGLPAVYYGDEYAFGGEKEERPGGDDEVRPPFPAADWQPAGGQAQMASLYRALIAMRQERPWLAGAVTEAPETSLANEKAVFVTRESGVGGAGDGGAGSGGDGGARSGGDGGAGAASGGAPVAAAGVMPPEGPTGGPAPIMAAGDNRSLIVEVDLGSTSTPGGPVAFARILEGAQVLIDTRDFVEGGAASV